MLTATRPDELLDSTRDDERDCLYCDCTPHMTICGKYNDPASNNDDWWTVEDVCADCVGVYRTGCPYCSCSPERECARCREAAR